MQPIRLKKSAYAGLGLAVALVTLTQPAWSNSTTSGMLKHQSQRVNQRVQIEATQLNRNQLNRVAALLNQIETVIEGTPVPSPGRPRPPLPRPRPGFYEIQAKVESMDVVFDGYTLQDIKSQCDHFMRQSNMRVDEITLNGQRVYKPTGYYSNEAVCALLTLNASEVGGTGSTVFEAKVEELPIRTSGRDSIEVQETLDTFVPDLLREINVDEIRVRNQRIYKPTGYYTGEQVVGILKHNVDPGYGRLTAEGKVEEIPFILRAQLMSQIESDCLEFMQTAMAGRQVDEVTVNSQRRYKSSSGYWSDAEVCMMVKSLAQ